LSGVEYRFNASVHGLGSGEEGQLATFYLMDTRPNRNGWAVTDGALESALPTLLGKPLGCIPGYRVNHVHRPLVVGRWVDAEKPDGYALATAEVTDPVAWGRIAAGEWGPVSVVIRAGRVTCSLCGADVTAAPDEHVLTGRAHEVVESFSFEGVDFVSEPAYSEAGPLGLKGTASADGRGLHLSLSRWDGTTGSRGSASKPGGKEGEMSGEQTQQHELETLRAENAQLRAAIQRQESERHEACVERAVEARLRAGLAVARDAEADRLMHLDEEALTLMAEDAEAMAARLTRAAAWPKARNTKTDGEGLDASMEEARMRLFGHGRRA
jgi:hypothetical protein